MKVARNEKDDGKYHVRADEELMLLDSNPSYAQQNEQDKRARYSKHGIEQRQGRKRVMLVS